MQHNAYYMLDEVSITVLAKAVQQQLWQKQLQLGWPVQSDSKASTTAK